MLFSHLRPQTLNSKKSFSPCCSLSLGLGGQINDLLPTDQSWGPVIAKLSLFFALVEFVHCVHLAALFKQAPFGPLIIGQHSLVKELTMQKSRKKRQKLNLLKTHRDLISNQSRATVFLSLSLPLFVTCFCFGCCVVFVLE